MNLVERVKNILIKPKEEWNVISQETTSITQLLTSYLLILALIPAIAAFVKQGILGTSFMGYHVPGLISTGIRSAIVSYISTVGGVFLSAFIIDILATSFGSQKNFTKAMLLVTYSFTPMMLAGIFQVIPFFGWLAIVGLYGLYILYLGLKPMMQTPDDKVTVYFIVSLLVIIVVYFVLMAIMGAVFLTKAAVTGAAIPGLQY